MSLDCKKYLADLANKKRDEEKIYEDIIQRSDVTNIDFYNKKLKRYLSEFNDWFSKVTFEASESSILDSIVGKIESDLIIGENSKNRTYKCVDLKDAKQATSMCSINDQFILLVDKKDNRIIKYNSEFKACEQVSSIGVRRLNRPSLICSDEIEYVLICDSDGTEIILCDINLKIVKRIRSHLIPDDYMITDIKFDNGTFYILDAGSYISFFRDPFETLSDRFLLRNKKNESLCNPIRMSVTECLIAILEDYRKVLIYNLGGTLVHEIIKENLSFLQSLCFVNNCLFLHIGSGLFICYQFHKVNESHVFELLFEREIFDLRETSNSMILLNKKLVILLPHAKRFIYF